MTFTANDNNVTKAADVMVRFGQTWQQIGLDHCNRRCRDSQNVTQGLTPQGGIDRHFRCAEKPTSQPGVQMRQSRRAKNCDGGAALDAQFSQRVGNSRA
jgi:hypothetical protein